MATNLADFSKSYRTFLENTYKQYQRLRDNITTAKEAKIPCPDVQIYQFKEWQDRVTAEIDTFKQQLSKMDASTRVQDTIKHVMEVEKLFLKHRLSDATLSELLGCSIVSPQRNHISSQDNAVPSNKSPSSPSRTSNPSSISFKPLHKDLVLTPDYFEAKWLSLESIGENRSQCKEIGSVNMGRMMRDGEKLLDTMEISLQSISIRTLAAGVVDGIMKLYCFGQYDHKTCSSTPVVFDDLVFIEILIDQKDGKIFVTCKSSTQGFSCHDPATLNGNLFDSITDLISSNLRHIVSQDAHM